MVETIRESAGCLLNLPIQIISLGTHKAEVVYDWGIYDSAKDAIVDPEYNAIAAAIVKGETTCINDMTPKRHNVRIEIVPVKVTKKHN